MGVPVDIVAMIRALVPGGKDLVEHMYWSDGDFRALCHDYRTCHATLERLRRVDTPEAARRRHEYAELLEELTREIRSWPGAPPGGEEER